MAGDRRARARKRAAARRRAAAHEEAKSSDEEAVIVAAEVDKEPNVACAEDGDEESTITAAPVNGGSESGRRVSSSAQQEEGLDESGQDKGSRDGSDGDRDGDGDDDMLPRKRSKHTEGKTGLLQSFSTPSDEKHGAGENAAPSAERGLDEATGQQQQQQPPAAPAITTAPPATTTATTTRLQHVTQPPPTEGPSLVGQESREELNEESTPSAKSDRGAEHPQAMDHTAVGEDDESEEADNTFIWRYFMTNTAHLPKMRREATLLGCAHDGDGDCSSGGHRGRQSLLSGGLVTSSRVAAQQALTDTAAENSVTPKTISGVPVVLLERVLLQGGDLPFLAPRKDRDAGSLAASDGVAGKDGVSPASPNACLSSSSSVLSRHAAHSHFHTAAEEGADAFALATPASTEQQEASTPSESRLPLSEAPCTDDLQAPQAPPLVQTPPRDGRGERGRSTAAYSPHLPLVSIFPARAGCGRSPDAPNRPGRADGDDPRASTCKCRRGNVFRAFTQRRVDRAFSLVNRSTLRITTVTNHREVISVVDKAAEPRGNEGSTSAETLECATTSTMNSSSNGNSKSTSNASESAPCSLARPTRSNRSCSPPGILLANRMEGDACICQHPPLHQQHPVVQNIGRIAHIMRLQEHLDVTNVADPHRAPSTSATLVKQMNLIADHLYNAPTECNALLPALSVLAAHSGFTAVSQRASVMFEQVIADYIKKMARIFHLFRDFSGHAASNFALMAAASREMVPAGLRSLSMHWDQDVLDYGLQLSLIQEALQEKVDREENQRARLEAAALLCGSHPKAKETDWASTFDLFGDDRDDDEGDGEDGADGHYKEADGVVHRSVTGDVPGPHQEEGVEPNRTEAMVSMAQDSNSGGGNVVDTVSNVGDASTTREEKKKLRRQLFESIAARILEQDTVDDHSLPPHAVADASMPATPLSVTTEAATPTEKARVSESIAAEKQGHPVTTPVTTKQQKTSASVLEEVLGDLRDSVLDGTALPAKATDAGETHRGHVVTFYEPPRWEPFHAKEQIGLLQ